MRVIVYQASDTSALSKNFTRKDFKCPCGCTRQMVDSELVEKLQAIRDKLGKAIKVTSGYRCITHNASKTVGGSPNSKHRYGMAADWRVVLLAEGVDRNYRVPWAVWRDMVALLAEGVDRNIPNGVITKITKGRPPRGGRG